MDEFRGILRYRVNSVFMNGLWPYKCKHTSELCGLPHVLCFKELQGWHHVTLSCHIMSLSLSLSYASKCILLLYKKSVSEIKTFSSKKSELIFSPRGLNNHIITSHYKPYSKTSLHIQQNIPVIASRAAASLGSYQTFLLCPHYERERDARISMMTMSSTCRLIYAVNSVNYLVL